MVETEITAIPPLTDAEQSVLNSHALLNLYRVVGDELAVFGTELTGQPGLLANSLSICEARAIRLRDPAVALQDAGHAHDLKDSIQREIEAHLQAPYAQITGNGLRHSRDRLDSLLWILQVRAHELVARAAAPQQWCQSTPDELQADFMELFRAMTDNSRGRYRFVYNLALQQAGDYYIDLRFESARGAIVMPPILKDVIRDLVANARKYTAPGGQVRAALHSSSEGLRFTVEDTGCGIPAEELQSVVHFGYRGTNVRTLRTLGAGCGLTKAFLATKQFGGRFWIASQEGHGTRIRLWIPPPPAGSVRGGQAGN